jgi:hypothetical protein
MLLCWLVEYTWAHEHRGTDRPVLERSHRGGRCLQVGPRSIGAANVVEATRKPETEMTWKPTVQFVEYLMKDVVGEESESYGMMRAAGLTKWYRAEKKGKGDEREAGSESRAVVIVTAHHFWRWLSG